LLELHFCYTFLFCAWMLAQRKMNVAWELEIEILYESFFGRHAWLDQTKRLHSHGYDLLSWSDIWFYNYMTVGKRECMCTQFSCLCNSEVHESESFYDSFLNCHWFVAWNAHYQNFHFSLLLIYPLPKGFHIWGIHSAAASRLGLQDWIFKTKIRINISSPLIDRGFRNF
jgi:hypothetical protein